MDFSLPVSSVFIASNFALATINHYNEVIVNCNEKYNSVLVTMTISSSLFCISASNIVDFITISEGTRTFLFRSSIFLLFATYLSLLFFCNYKNTSSYKSRVAAKKQSESLSEDLDWTRRKEKEQDQTEETSLTLKDEDN